MKETIERQMAFIREMDKMKGVLRRNMMLDGTRNEDDAQHSWHIALMALVLSEYAQPGVNIDHAVRMLLVHDIVEVDAGDTYAYDEKGYTDKAEREQKAAARLFGLLPNGQGEALRALWEEFEANQTPTAQYANAIDRLQPLWGNFWVGGHVWKQNHITRAAVEKRNAVAKEVLPEVWSVTERMLDEAVEKGVLR